MTYQSNTQWKYSVLVVIVLIEILSVFLTALEILIAKVLEILIAIGLIEILLVVIVFLSYNNTIAGILPWTQVV